MRRRAITHTTALTILAGLLGLLVLAPSASADLSFCPPGSGAGQCQNPQGLAVDFETGRLYVVDTKNNRINVFESTGAFVMAFGWGVDTGANEFQTCTAASTCNAGIAGSGAGQLHSDFFGEGATIAVDNDPASPSQHDVYVFDDGNSRVQKFDPAGSFLLAFGSAGSGACQFNDSFSSADPNIAVGPGGVVYVADSTSTGDGNFSNQVEKFEPSGACLPSVPLSPITRAKAIAVDSTGDIYIAFQVFGGIRKFHPDGSEYTAPPYPLDITVGPKFGKETHALAIDTSDNLFAAQRDGDVQEGQVITEYAPTGAHLKRFGYGTINQFLSGLAVHHSADGDVFGSERSAGLRYLAIPPPGPIVKPSPCEASPLGNTKVTLNAEVNPEGKATTVHFEYVDQESFENEGGFSGPNTKTTAESESIGSDFALHKGSAQATPLVPETKYHCRVVATNADAPGGIAGEEGTFTSLAPLEIGETWTSEIGSETATLNATVNPLGIPTTGFFEYVDEATYEKDVAELGPEHGFDHALKAPAGEEIDFGAGESFKAGSVTIGGLASGTAYRYRIIATDPYFPSGFPGPTKAFRTYRSAAATLPDDRAWELVSPAQKNSAEVAVPGGAGGFFSPEYFARIQAAADSGEAVTYTSWSSFGDPKGASGASQYLSKRTSSGWGTENISPFGRPRDLNTPYRGFTSDLGFSAFAMREPPLTKEAQAGIENLYLRDNGTGALQALTIEAPDFTPGGGFFGFFCTTYAGSSADGKRAFFAATGAMAGAPPGIGFSLYEWSAAEGLKLVSVLPDGNPAAPDKETHFGAEARVCVMGGGIVAPAVSEDGSTAFWTYGGKYSGSEKPLMARIDGVETVQLDAKETGAKAGKGPAGNGIFWAASADGSKAFLTAPGKLTKDSGAEGQLYRYDLEERSLTDLTPGALAPKIQGVIGASKDGAYLYFVAQGALTGEEEGTAGQKAKAGRNNLYLWHEGEGLRFIATLSDQHDERAWSSSPREQTARVTPDGRHLAFLSVETQALAGYDNTIFPGAGCRVAANAEGNLEGTDPRCAEAFLYDAEADTLTCASCNPSGARPKGPAELPVWTNPYEGPRFISDDGQRLYFESRDVLSPADENGKRDVYLFEREGKGTCTSESADFDATSGGCIFLISSGRSEDATYLVDASSSGRDVFFSTREALVGWDVNENYDVYDARAGGGFPEPTEGAICEAEACKAPPAPAPPSGASPATATFQGPGNAAGPRPRCAKGKVRRKARCVKRHGKAQRKGKAERKGRGAR